MSRIAKALLVVFLAVASQNSAAQAPQALPLPDERYKVDLLLVVAHPDDEGAATPYLARALDEHKRVAVVFGTRGSSGANEAGAEQAAALGAVREIEARNALTTLGINNVWFLGGKDTATTKLLGFWRRKHSIWRAILLRSPNRLPVQPDVSNHFSRTCVPGSQKRFITFRMPTAKIFFAGKDLTIR